MHDDLPSVALLILGGEPCTSELVEHWAHGRRMLNTYGPTEATIICTASECASGRPVSIGYPLPGHSILICDENLKPVSCGEIGELLIGGAGVARSYLNEASLTNDRFISNPCSRSGRFYRTHDLERLNDEGALEFVGRTDSQVKVRGYRIDLAEIEGILLDQPEVRAAVVKIIDHGNEKEIAAYVVPNAGSDIVRPALFETLSQRLPHYMIPKYLDVIEAIPRAGSGKLDRSILPPPRLLLTSGDRQEIKPATITEIAIADAVRTLFEVDAVYACDDFFLDLHGHSLLIARTAAELRVRHPELHISVRDFYEHRTVRHLAAHLASQHRGVRQNAGPAGDPDRAANDVTDVASSGMRLVCATCQAVVLLVYYGVATAPLTGLVFIASELYRGTIDAWSAIGLVTTAATLVWPSWVVLAIVLKWLLIGRYRPGKHRLWSMYYLRWWTVARFQSLTWCSIFSGTPLMALFYRAMGAHVGVNSNIRTPHCSAFDLISIGDEASIGPDTQLLGYRVEDGFLILGEVQIGNECFVGTHCCLGLDVHVGDHAKLDDMSLLPDGSRMAPHEMRSGSPARPAEVGTDWAATRPGVRPRPVVYGIIHLLLIYAMGYVLLLSIAPSLILLAYAFLQWGPDYAAAMTVPAVLLAGVCYLLCVLAIKAVFVCNIAPGVYHVQSGTYLRLWFLQYLLDNARYILLPMYSTLLFPPVLRLLGARIGAGVEISTVIHIVPNLLRIGSGSFFADACIVGGFRICRGWVDVQEAVVGERSFIGNSAIVPVGARVGNRSLLGVMSKPPKTAPPDGTRWLGSPSFEISYCSDRRADESKTYAPPAALLAGRLAMEMLRLALPSIVLGLNIIIFVTLAALAYDCLALPLAISAASAIVVLLTVVTVLCSSIVKGLLIGTFIPERKPLWSTFVWRNEVINGLYESTMAYMITPLLGTPFIAPCLRSLGCKIGKWAFIETTLFSEFDLVTIGDHAALNLGSTIQTHLFEDRVMKSDRLAIGSRCTIGNMSTVLYGTTIQDGAVVRPLSLVMKGELLPASTLWQGIPVEQVAPHDTVATPASRAA
jgi:non-ribosomal peptide synthetase-like protein